MLSESRSPFSITVIKVYTLICVLTLCSAARAQFNNVEPAAPGSIEYSLTLQGKSWVQTSDPISLGNYVYDLLTFDRQGQPDGRGAIGIVTGTSFDPDYNEMAASVDFGRNYTVGIVFSELSAVQIVPEPSPLWIGAAGILAWCAVRGWRTRTVS